MRTFVSCVVLFLLVLATAAQQGLRDPSFLAGLNLSASASSGFKPNQIPDLALWIDVNEDPRPDSTISSITNYQGGDVFINPFFVNTSIATNDWATNRAYMIPAPEYYTNLTFTVQTTNEYWFVVCQKQSSGTSGRRLISHGTTAASDTGGGNDALIPMMQSSTSTIGPYIEGATRSAWSIGNFTPTIWEAEYTIQRGTNWTNTGLTFNYSRSSGWGLTQFVSWGLGASPSGASIHGGTWEFGCILLYTNIPSDADKLLLRQWATNKWAL